MPEVTGLEIVNILKDSPVIRTTKIILMTASDIPSEDLTNLMKIGVADGLESQLICKCY